MDAEFAGVREKNTWAVLQFTDLWENICFTTFCYISIDLPEISVLNLCLPPVPMRTSGHYRCASTLFKAQRPDFVL